MLDIQEWSTCINGMPKLKNNFYYRSFKELYLEAHHGGHNIRRSHSRKDEYICWRRQYFAREINGAAGKNASFVLCVGGFERVFMVFG